VLFSQRYMMNHFIQCYWVIHGWILSYSDRKEFHRFSGGGFIHYSSENLDQTQLACNRT